MRFRGMVALAAGLLWFGTAHAATLEVEVNDQRGQPVSDAVVTLLPGAGVQLPPSAVSTTPRFIDQRRLVFMPYVEVFRQGERVVFRNSDDTRHHVYSFSAPKAFEFVVAPHTSSAPLLLDKSGVVAVGCNIHDGMITYLYVTDAPRAARTDATGRVSLGDQPSATTVAVIPPLPLHSVQVGAHMQVGIPLLIGRIRIGSGTNLTTIAIFVHITRPTVRTINQERQ